jgi:protein-disulfide isomerase
MLTAYLIAALSLGRAALGGAQGSLGEAELAWRVRAFVARTRALVPLNQILIVDMSPPDEGGLRKVVLQLGKGTPPVREVIYVTANGREVLEGAVAPLVEDPWERTREKLASVIAGAPVDGPPSAPVTIVEFSDFECPYCRQLNSELRRIRAELPNTVRWVFINFPLTAIHPWAMRAAVSSVCVADQGVSSFWKFEQGVYENQLRISNTTAAVQLRSLAQRSGVDLSRYDGCVRSASPATRVQSQIDAGKALGISGTPTLFINGRELSGAVSVEALEAAIGNEVALQGGQRGQ